MVPQPGASQERIRPVRRWAHATGPDEGEAGRRSGGELRVKADERRLRALLSRWDYVRSPAELTAMGLPALERILDATDGHGSLDEEGVDWRAYEDARQAAIAAFAARDVAGVLAAMRRRGWADGSIALSGIGRVPDLRVVEVLRTAYASKEPFTRQRIVTLLGMQRGPEAVDALVKALSDRSSAVRLAAVEALGEIGDRRAVAPLRALATRSARSRELVGRIDEVLAKMR
jgi:hypothetical protein